MTLAKVVDFDVLFDHCYCDETEQQMSTELLFYFFKGNPHSYVKSKESLISKKNKKTNTSQLCSRLIKEQ